MNILRRKFNESQFGAIEAAATESGFTLIKVSPQTHIRPGNEREKTERLFASQSGPRTRLDRPSA